MKEKEQGVEGRLLILMELQVTLGEHFNDISWAVASILLLFPFIFLRGSLISKREHP